MPRPKIAVIPTPPAKAQSMIVHTAAGATAALGRRIGNPCHGRRRVGARPVYGLVATVRAGVTV